MQDYKMLNFVAYDHILAMIHNNELEFNRVYSETRLSTQLSISRTPVREALVRLNNERYIDILPSRGFMLHKPTSEDITEAYHVRLSTEDYCSRIIARQYETPEAQKTISLLREYARKQRHLNELSWQENRVEFWQTDVLFHGQIVAYINCPAFDNLMNTFMHFFTSLRLKNFIPEGRNMTTLLEHEQLVDALSRGDEQAAAQTVRTHMDRTLVITLQNLD